MSRNFKWQGLPDFSLLVIQFEFILIVRAGTWGKMEPIFSEQIHIWNGLVIAAAFVAIRLIAGWVFKKPERAVDESDQDSGSVSWNATGIFLPDVVFAFSYLMFGLQSALVYRLVLSCWTIGRKLILGPAKRPAFLLFMVSMNIALAYIIIQGSEVGLHIYGLVVFTFWYGIMIHKSRSKIVQDEGSGSLGMIRIVSVMSITYLLILGLSELLWVTGGMDYWVWFYILVKLFAIAGGLFSIVVLLPFLKAFMRAVRAASGPLG